MSDAAEFLGGKTEKTKRTKRMKKTRQLSMAVDERFDRDIDTIRQRYGKTSDAQAIRYVVHAMAHIARHQGANDGAARLAQLDDDGKVKVELVFLG